MNDICERLSECAELLHDEGFDRSQSPILEVLAARAEIERLRAELASKDEPPRPAAIVRTLDGEVHAFAESADAMAFYSGLDRGDPIDPARTRLIIRFPSWTWHPKSSREHPAT